MPRSKALNAKGHDPSQAFENLYTAKNSDDSSLRFGPFNSAIVREDDTQLRCAAAPTVLCPWDSNWQPWSLPIPYWSG